MPLGTVWCVVDSWHASMPIAGQDGCNPAYTPLLPLPGQAEPETPFPQDWTGPLRTFPTPGQDIPQPQPQFVCTTLAEPCCAQQTDLASSFPGLPVPNTYPLPTTQSLLPYHLPQAGTGTSPTPPSFTCHHHLTFPSPLPSSLYLLLVSLGQDRTLGRWGLNLAACCPCLPCTAQLQPLF